MMTDRPSAFFIRSASTRPRVSVGPPAGNGTTMVIGRVGNDCARAKDTPSEVALLAASQCRSVRREDFITPYELSFKIYHGFSCGSAGFIVDWRERWHVLLAATHLDLAAST